MTDAEPSFQHTTRSTTSRHPPCEVLKIQVRDEVRSGYTMTRSPHVQRGVPEVLRSAVQCSVVKRLSKWLMFFHAAHARRLHVHSPRYFAFLTFSCILTSSQPKQTGSVLWFQLKTTQKLKRLFDSYKARMLSAAQQDVQFVYKGLYLEATHTPQQLHMKDGDVMECVRVQVQPVLQEAITVVVRDQNNIKIWFKIRTTQRLRLLFQHYAKLVRYPAHAFQFSFQGQSLTQHHTSAEIGLKEGDIIECFSPFPASAA